jgi:hypothetical protein
LDDSRKDEIESFFHVNSHILNQILTCLGDSRMTWKAALYEYVNAKNQAEMKGSIEPLSSLVDDTEYIRTQQARLLQTTSILHERGAKPLRSETRLRLLGIQETEGQVIADIKLHRTFEYEIKETPYTEQRIEHERVTLYGENSKWRISGSEADFSEKNEPAEQPDFLFHAFEPTLSESYRLPSIPYMNYSILGKEETSLRAIRYDRSKAVQYAEMWWNRSNPKYVEFAVDCTSFVSQCLFAGGAPMNYTGKRGTGWWYAGKQGAAEHWSYSWAVAHSLQLYTTASRRGMRGTEVSSPQQLQPGDIISYDWDGDGRFQHSTIVTAIDVNGAPLVNAHTYNARHRYWEYRDSPAWTSRTRYAFVRIADEM